MTEKIRTAHFGEVDFETNKKLTFEKGLPGLDDEKAFALLTQEDQKPICWLQSLVHWQIALPVINPFLIEPSYAFDITDSDVASLGVESVNDVCVLSVLVVPKNPNDMTVNLVAPIIINMKNWQGRQIILDDKRYSTRTRVSDMLDELRKKTEEDDKKTEAGAAEASVQPAKTVN